MALDLFQWSSFGGVLHFSIKAEWISAGSSFEWNAGQLPRGLYHYSQRGSGVSESGGIVLE